MTPAEREMLKFLIADKMNELAGDWDWVPCRAERRNKFQQLLSVLIAEENQKTEEKR